MKGDRGMKKMSQIRISGGDEGTEEALDAVDKYIRSSALENKKALHLRLICEETLGMVRAMTGDFEALFWIEEENGEFKVRLQADTIMDKEKKEALLSVSTKHENASAKGFMGKISDIIQNGLLSFDESAKLQQEYGVGYDFMTMGLMGEYPAAGVPMMWSLENYRGTLQDSESEEKDEEVDELEKSIVASLAKDVIVGVKNDQVDLTIVLK